MTATQLTVETAPRDLAELSKLGRFNLRSLAVELGAFDSGEDAKVAFMQMDSNKQAEEVLRLMQARDGRGKGKAATATGSARSPVTGGRTRRTQAESSTEQQEDPAAARAPVTHNAGNQQGGSPAPGAGTTQLLVQIKAIASAQATLASSVEGIETALDNIGGAIAGIQGTSAGDRNALLMATNVLLTLMEENMGAPREDIIRQAVEDIPTLRASLKAILVDEEGGDRVEGNE